MAGGEPMVAKQEGWGMVRRGRTTIGPSNRGGVVTTDQDALVLGGVVVGNCSGLCDDGSQFQVRVGDGSMRVLKGDKLVLQGDWYWCPPNKGAAPIVAMGLAIPHAPHASFTSI